MSANNTLSAAKEWSYTCDSTQDQISSLFESIDEIVSQTFAEISAHISEEEMSSISKLRTLLSSEFKNHTPLEQITRLQHNAIMETIYILDLHTNSRHSSHLTTPRKPFPLASHLSKFHKLQAQKTDDNPHETGHYKLRRLSYMLSPSLTIFRQSNLSSINLTHHKANINLQPTPHNNLHTILHPFVISFTLAILPMTQISPAPQTWYPPTAAPLVKIQQILQPAQRLCGLDIHPTTGEIYACKTTNASIEILSHMLSFITRRRSPTNLPVPLSHPTSISIHPNASRIAVADNYSNCVHIFDAEWSLITTISKIPKASTASTRSGADGQTTLEQQDLLHPRCVVFDGIGSLFVAVGGHSRVVKLSESGYYLCDIIIPPPKGEKSAPVMSPSSIIVEDASTVLLLGRGADVVHRFSLSGRFVESLKIKKTTASSPNALARGSNGSFFVADREGDLIVHYSHRGDIMAEYVVESPMSMAVTHQGRLVVAQWFNDCVSLW
eukprot:TRINITY_DN5963_c0_g2_i1.p1 TRINITY_DN5963_c0_g2~~TRINITY_DN5963_c0_g2_i1.p1  ORF type:complete len:497 (+),score=98.38 TRINITY_DN5963_c0_g2_i1:57-1547(+)